MSLCGDFEREATRSRRGERVAKACERTARLQALPSAAFCSPLRLTVPARTVRCSSRSCSEVRTSRTPLPKLAAALHCPSISALISIRSAPCCTSCCQASRLSAVMPLASSQMRGTMPKDARNRSRIARCFGCTGAVPRTESVRVSAQSRVRSPALRAIVPPRIGRLLPRRRERRAGGTRSEQTWRPA